MAIFRGLLTGEHVQSDARTGEVTEGGGGIGALVMAYYTGGMGLGGGKSGVGGMGGEVTAGGGAVSGGMMSGGRVEPTAPQQANVGAAGPGALSQVLQGQWDSTLKQQGIRRRDEEDTRPIGRRVYEAREEQGFPSSGGDDDLFAEQYGATEVPARQGRRRRSSLSARPERRRGRGGSPLLRTLGGGERTPDLGYFQHGGPFELPEDTPLDETGHGEVKLHLKPGEVGMVLPDGEDQGMVTPRMQHYMDMPTVEPSRGRAILSGLLSKNPMGYYRDINSQTEQLQRERLADYTREVLAEAGERGLTNVQLQRLAVIGNIITEDQRSVPRIPQEHPYTREFPDPDTGYIMTQDVRFDPEGNKIFDAAIQHPGARAARQQDTKDKARTALRAEYRRISPDDRKAMQEAGHPLTDPLFANTPLGDPKVNTFQRARFKKFSDAFEFSPNEGDYAWFLEQTSGYETPESDPVAGVFDATPEPTAGGPATGWRNLPPPGAGDSTATGWRERAELAAAGESDFYGKASAEMLAIQKDRGTSSAAQQSIMDRRLAQLREQLTHQPPEQFRDILEAPKGFRDLDPVSDTAEYMESLPEQILSMADRSKRDRRAELEGQLLEPGRASRRQDLLADEFVVSEDPSAISMYQDDADERFEELGYTRLKVKRGDKGAVLDDRNFDPEFRGVFDLLEELAPETKSGDVVITSGVDSHAEGKHPIGRAIDVGTRDMDSGEAKVFAKNLQGRLGAGWTVVLESDHIHIQMGRKG